MITLKKLQDLCFDADTQPCCEDALEALIEDLGFVEVLAKVANRHPDTLAAVFAEESAKAPEFFVAEE